MSNRTITRPQAPKYSVYQTVYSRVSATKGYVEPMLINEIGFDPARLEYVYGFSREMTRQIAIVNPWNVLPVKLHESELIDLCEALDIQISVLIRELSDLREKITTQTVSSESESVAIIPNSSFLQTPPRPKFGYNQVVYLRETSQTVGRLEAYRITDLGWNCDVGEWIYYFQIQVRFATPMTVGDRDNMKRPSLLSYPESQLCMLAEALSLAELFLERALLAAQHRKERLCGTGSTG